MRSDARKRADVDPHVAGWDDLAGRLHRAEAQVRDMQAKLAAAWDEGHHTPQKLGPDGCECSAWNESECGCGLYGTNIITPNPYRAALDGGA